MSALGQKQTCAVQNSMSALHPKADMCGATMDVRFVPIADMRTFTRQLCPFGQYPAADQGLRISWQPQMS